MANAALDHGLPGEFELGYIADADDQMSIEVICDNCRGLGHIKRVCPSNRNRPRSLSYAIGVLNSKLESMGNAPPRRPPGRGQRPPFRSQPRRFQPARRGDGRPFIPFGRGRGRGGPRARSAEEGDRWDEWFGDQQMDDGSTQRANQLIQRLEDLLTERDTARAVDEPPQPRERLETAVEQERIGIAGEAPPQGLSSAYLRF